MSMPASYVYYGIGRMAAESQKSSPKPNTHSIVVIDYCMRGDQKVLKYSKKQLQMKTVTIIAQCIIQNGGTASASSPPFMPSNPALCGSRPLVTPYYC